LFKKKGNRWLTPVILATQKAERRRITDQSQPQAKRPYLEKIHYETGLIERLRWCLPSKHQALSSNPSITKGTFSVHLAYL
jgi:hypothetical protein